MDGEDPQLVQDILRAAAEECEYDYATLQGWYDDGTVTIEKISEGYQVSGGGNPDYTDGKQLILAMFLDRNAFVYVSLRRYLVKRRFSISN